MTHELLDSRRITPRQFCVIFLCFFGMLLDGLDIVIISFTAPSISQDWGLGSGQLGVVFSSGLVGMTIGAMFMSSIADIHGRRLLVSAALVVAGLSTLAVCYANSVTELMILRFIAGIGLGTLMAVLPALGGEFSPRVHRTFILSIMVSGTSVGSVLGGLIAAPFIPAFGWRALYLYTGIVITLTGFVFYAVVPESLQYLLSREKADPLGKINRVLLYLKQQPATSLPEQETTVVESASVKSLLTPSRRNTTFLTWGAFFMGFASMYFMTSWFPKLFVDAGIPQQESIHAVVILTFGSIFGAMATGWMAKRWQLNYLLAIAFAIAAALVVVLSMVLRQPEGALTLIWILSFLIGLTLYGGFANLYTIALAIYPPQVRITGVGWCYGLGRAGAIISPTAAGLLLGLGMSSPNVLAIFAITVAIAAILVHRIKLKELA